VTTIRPRNSYCALLLLLLTSLVISGCGSGSADPKPAPNPVQPPAVNGFTASSSSVVAGSPVTLSWNVSNVSGVQIDNGIGAQPAVGSTTVMPQSSTTYTLTASNTGGQVTKSVTVAVSSAPPTITLSASPTTINSGDATTLTWQSTNATEVTISPEIGEIGEELPVSGSQSVTLPQTATFVAKAIGPGGTVQSSPVTVTVNQLPPTVTFTATPPSILAGQSSTLSWITDHTTSVTIDHGIGEVAAIGDKQVTPTITTTYTLTATGLGGTQTATATVTVAPASQLSVTINASPASIASGQKSTLTWSSQNATSVKIDQGIGDVQLNGSTEVSPAATTTYTATASDANGNTATSSTTVTIVSGGDFKSKIKHIIFFVQENRSFDNYFSNLGAYKASKGFANDVNLDYNPNVQLRGRQDRLVSPYHQRTVCTDNLSPSWNESHFDIHETSPGVFKMDGFLITTSSIDTGDRDLNGDRAMGFYDERDLPYYYELATQFATSDRWFSPVLTNTVNNRYYLFAGTSFGHVHDTDPRPAGGWPQKTIFEMLTDANISWGYYLIEHSFLATHFAYGSSAAYNTRKAPISKWFEILADPNADDLLPQVVFIESGSGSTGLDEHPKNNIQKGAAFTKQMIDALLQSGAWQSSVFIWTFDEGGGLYDHVPPVPMAHPDGIQPILRPGDAVGDFTRSAFRVPLLVISPWVKPHFVSHENRDFTAILKLIQERFDLPALTERDKNQISMLEFFDFSAPAWATPPPLPDQPTDAPCSLSLQSAP
jgi:phospholipase C